LIPELQVIGNIKINTIDMHYYSFEKLNVWQISRVFASTIYKVTEGFPENEKFGMVSQLRRASISICSNIAEGNSRFSPRDRSRFFEIAYSSTMEVLNQLIISNDLNWINQTTLDNFRTRINEITNKLNALIKNNSK
jgi:four helix bundle protein